MAHILAFLFYSALRQCYDIWASQFSFLQIFKDNVLSSKVCLYGHINWSLAQTQQQLALSLSHCSTSVRGEKPGPRLVSILM